MTEVKGVSASRGGATTALVQRSHPPRVSLEESLSKESAKKKTACPRGEEWPRVLVTVGSTSFDGLVAATESAAFLDALRCIGRVALTVQVGRGKKLPFGISSECAELNADGVYANLDGFASVRVVRFLPSLSRLLPDFDLIISHCGAATLLEALRASRRVVACVNPSLLHNHQLELAVQLAKEQHCVALDCLVDLPRKTLEAWRRPLLGAPQTPPPSAAAGARTTGDRDILKKPLLPLPPPNRGRFVAMIEEEVTEDMESEI